MPVRHAILALAAVLVMGMCVYLFFEVRSSPAAPQAKADVVASKDVEPEDKADDVASDAPVRRVASPGGLRNMVRKSTGDASSTESAPTAETPAGEPGKLEDVKLGALMDEANKAYDKQDFEEARSIAQRVLKQQPTNVRMLRIMASAACIEVDPPEAQKWFNLLPAPDRAQIKTRCARYNVTLADPPAK